MRDGLDKILVIVFWEDFIESRYILIVLTTTIYKILLITLAFI